MGRGRKRMWCGRVSGPGDTCVRVPNGERQGRQRAGLSGRPHPQAGDSQVRVAQRQPARQGAAALRKRAQVVHGGRVARGSLLWRQRGATSRRWNARHAVGAWSYKQRPSTAQRYTGLGAKDAGPLVAPSRARGCGGRPRFAVPSNRTNRQRYDRVPTGTQSGHFRTMAGRVSTLVSTPDGDGQVAAACAELAHAHLTTDANCPSGAATAVLCFSGVATDAAQGRLEGEPRRSVGFV